MMRYMFDSLCDFSFNETIQRSCSFVKDENIRIAEQCSGNSKTLSLSARKFESAFTDSGIESLLVSADDIFYACSPQDFHTILICSIWRDKKKVVSDCTIKQLCILSYYTKMLRKDMRIKAVYVHIID